MVDYEPDTSVCEIHLAAVNQKVTPCSFSGIGVSQECEFCPVIDQLKPLPARRRAKGYRSPPLRDMLTLLREVDLGVKKDTIVED